MVEKYDQSAFEFPDLYKGQQGKVLATEYVSAVIHAIDKDKGKDEGTGVQRVWVNAIKPIKILSGGNDVSSNFFPPSNRDAKLNNWYFDCRVAIPTNDPDRNQIDFPGMRVTDDFKNDYFRYETSFELKTDYAIAIVCWKDNAIVKKPPLAIFYYSVNVTVSKDDQGKFHSRVVFKANDTTQPIPDWTVLKNYQTNQPVVGLGQPVPGPQ